MDLSNLIDAVKSFTRWFRVVASDLRLVYSITIALK